MTQQELERAIQEVWTLFKDTDKKIAEVSKTAKIAFDSVTALTGKWGKFVEGLIAPGAAAMFKERGIEVRQVYTRAKSYRDTKEMEIDVLVTNEQYAVVIEVKSTLKVEDIDEHLENLKRFKEFFPVYKDRKVVGAVAGIVIEERADKYAYHKGLFVIGQKGETVKILNDKQFKPKVW